MVIDNPYKFIAHMKNNKIDIAQTNLSLCSHLEIYPIYKKITPNALSVKKYCFFVPIYPGLKINNIKYLAKSINFFLEDVVE